MILKDYQRKVLEHTKDLLVALYARREKVERMREVDAEMADSVDWVKQAFDAIAPDATCGGV